ARGSDGAATCVTDVPFPLPPAHVTVRATPCPLDTELRQENVPLFLVRADTGRDQQLTPEPGLELDVRPVDDVEHPRGQPGTIPVDIVDRSAHDGMALSMRRAPHKGGAQDGVVLAGSGFDGGDYRHPPFDFHAVDA